MSNHYHSKADIAAICWDAAAMLHNGKAPSLAYTERVGRLLYGTACTESALTHRRQIGFGFEDIRGGWGLMQTESGSVLDSMAMLTMRRTLRQNAEAYLLQHQSGGPFDITMLERMQMLTANDAASVMFGRLHYMRRPEPVPVSLLDQAEYWKSFYNTPRGKGTVQRYMERWRTIGADVWDQIVEARM